MTLQELFAGRSMDIHKMMEQWQQVAGQEGLALGVRTHTYNSRLAQELAKWAEYEGEGPAFHDAVFKAYFAHGKNIGLIETLVDVARSINLSAEDARQVLETRAFKEAVDMDWTIAKSMGITAVPTFVINKQGIVGAQPYDVLEKFLQDNQVPERSQNASAP